MLRKTFLWSLILAASLVMVWAMEPAPAAARDFPAELKVGGFLIGPQAYTFNRFTFFEAIDKAKQAGAHVIEAYPGQKLSPDDPRPFSHDSPPDVLEKVKAKLESTGIHMVNYGVVGLGNEEAANRKVFDFAKKMGIPCITSEPEKGSFDLLEKLVKEYDIKLAIHDHPKQEKNPSYRYWDPNYVLECVKGRDPRMGACADTGHWIRSDVKPLEAMKILEGRIISLHLKDLNSWGVPHGHDVHFGEGVADISKILDELKRQKFNGNTSIEYEYNWEKSVDDVKACIDYVREYGKTH